MPLDPNIALSVKPAPFNNPFEVLAQMQHLKAQSQVINSNQALEEQRRAKIKQDEDEQKRSAAVAQAITDIKTGNHEAVLANLDPQARLLAEEWLTKDADTKRQRAVLQRKDLQDRAQLIRAFDYNPAIAEIQFGLIADDFPEASKSWEDVKGDPEKLRALVDRVADIDAKPAAAPEGFSLSPGQSRFDPTGKQIANVPAAAAPSAAPQDFTLTPGGVRFDASGKQIAAVPAAEKAASEPGSIDAAIAAARNDPMELNRLLVIKRKMAEATREPATVTADKEPLVAIMGPDGKPVLVKRSNAENKTPATTREQGRQVTSGDAGRIAELDTSLNDLDTLTEKLGTTGAGSYIGTKVPNFVSEYTGWGTDSKSRQATIDRVKQVIGKALEGGVLRKEDEIKYEKILPTIGDPPGVAKTKLEGLKAAIEQRRQTTLDALKDANYDIGNFEKRVRPPKKPTAEELKKRAADLIKKHGG